MSAVDQKELTLIGQYGDHFDVYKLDDAAGQFKSIFHFEYSKSWFIKYNQINTELKIKSKKKEK